MAVLIDWLKRIKVTRALSGVKKCLANARYNRRIRY